MRSRGEGTVWAKALGLETDGVEKASGLGSGWEWRPEREQGGDRMWVVIVGSDPMCWPWGREPQEGPRAVAEDKLGLSPHSPGERGGWFKETC